VSFLLDSILIKDLVFYTAWEVKQKIRTLTLSASASGNETLAVVLMEHQKNVSLTVGTTAHNAFQIAATPLPRMVGLSKRATCVSVADKAEPRSGTFSFL